MAQALIFQRVDQRPPRERIARHRIQIRLAQVQPHEPRPLVGIDVPHPKNHPGSHLLCERDDLATALEMREHLKQEIE